MNLRARLRLLRRSLLASAALVVGLAGAACLSQPQEAEMAPSPAEAVASDGLMDKEELAFGGGGAPGAPPPPAASAPSRAAKKTAPSPKGGVGRGRLALSNEMAADESAPEPVAVNDQPADAAPTVVRAWFPETLLFEPRVVTDANGHAEIPVLVPDRLTDWRVLALAHSGDGAQAGAVTRFASRMDAYVDAVVPAFLLAGDRAVLPVQVVNTTAAPLVRELLVAAEGAVIENGKTKLTVPPRSSKTLYLPLRTKAPGDVVVTATLAGEDAVSRTIPVEAAGKPGDIAWSGNLAGARNHELAIPDEAIDGSIEARLTVFPGALAVLRSELAAAPSRSSIADDAYALLLAGRAGKLAAALGAQVDDKELRRLRLVATQRVLRHARSPSEANAALLAEAALAHEGEPLLGRLGERLAQQVAQAQRPDGTFGGGSGWSLQRVLVATADGMRAIEAGANTGKAGERRVAAARLRARSAFARHLPMVEDPYTAAAALAAGVVEGKAKDELVARVKKALEKGTDGTRWLPVGDGVVRADGGRPSTVEATALAALALFDVADASALLPDLGAYLLANYRGGAGFGDGYANLVALAAVTRIFKDPLPTRVAVHLTRDGETVTDVVLEGDKLKKQSGVTARPEDAAGAHEWGVSADPPVPGLAFTLTLSWRSPWPPPDDDTVQVAAEHERKVRVGVSTPVTLRATAPGGAALEIHQSLPAGVQADRGSLDALVEKGTISRYELKDGTLTLLTPERRQGQMFVATYRVIPSLSGTLHSGPTELRARGATIWVPGEAWEISR